MIKEHSWVTYLGQKAFVRQYQDHGYFEIIIMEKNQRCLYKNVSITK